MNLRKIASHVLCRVLKDGQSLTAALESELTAVEKTADKAFVQAVCYGAVRDYSQLAFLAAQLLDKPLRTKDSDINALILIGLYQLRSMRVKPHAAVSETVAAVGKKSWAKNIVNAVLRQYLRDQTALEARLHNDALASSGHPPWLVQAIQHDWPEQAATLFSENNQQPPMTLRINRLHTTPVDYCQLLQTHGIDAQPVMLSQTAVQLSQPVNVAHLPHFADGWVSVQDAAAQFAAPLLAVQAGQRVLDLCAAPGGKTAAVLEWQPHIAELVAVDIDDSRLQRVRDNLSRLQLPAQVVCGDACQPAQWWDGRPFERILLDAPCSALGVIRRHPDIKLLRRADDIAALQMLQSQLLAAAWTMLARGGRLLYATCSILKVENEMQIATFLAAHADSVEIPILADWGQPRSVGRQILTGEAAMDGFYYACLEKR